MKPLLSTLSMAVAMTFSAYAAAGQVGVVTIDGVQQSVNVDADFTIGSDNSQVIVSAETGNYLMYSGSEANRTINGKDIQFQGTDKNGLQFDGKGEFKLGSETTNKISFAVNGGALEISNGNSTVTSQKIVVNTAKSGFSASNGEITINAKDSVCLNVNAIGIKAYNTNAKIHTKTHELTIIVNESDI